jgi:hypothetical protein
MIQFNELRITPDSQHLIIDVSIDNSSYYDNVILDSIVIDTQDTYVANGPSSKPIYTYNIDTENNYNYTYSTPEECSCNPVVSDDDKAYCLTYASEQNKYIRLILSAKDLGISLNDNILFVYAIATGTPAPDTPCGMDNSIVMSTVVNLYPVYQNTMCYLRELDSDCQVPKGFIDMILRLKAVELCIRTGNYTKAISYWKRFFLGRTQVPTYNCGCNGRIN